MIVVGGEALVDLLVQPGGEISPRPGGGPYNVARTIGRLGLPVTFLGRLSADRFGRQMALSLALDGVALGCPDPVDEPTTLALAELDADGHAAYRFYLEGTSAPGLRPADVLRTDGLHAAALHLGTLGLVAEPIGSTLEALVGRASEETVVMVDPNCRPSAIGDPAGYRARIARILLRADVVKASREDLAYLDPDRSVADAVRAMLGAGGHGPSVILVTAGAGVAVASTRDNEIEVEVPRVAVVDTVGAGDAFGGAFLAWWIAAGLGRAELSDVASLRPAVEVAVAVAARTCERAGADPPRLTELGPLAARWPTGPPRH